MTGKHCKAVVTSRRDVNSSLWVLRLAPEQKVSFQPGQYVTLGLPGQQRMIERPYSLVSSPREPELEFFLELVQDGQLTPNLYTVPVGGLVFMRPSAKGHFLFDRQSGRRNHLMVCTVTGVAPFLSMLRDFSAAEKEGSAFPYRIAVLQSGSLALELGYLEELTRYAHEHSWLHYIPSVSRIWLDSSWKGEVGRAEDVVRKHMDSHGFTSADTTAYMCGNPNMIINVKGILERAGFTKEGMREEKYWVEAEKGA